MVFWLLHVCEQWFKGRTCQAWRGDGFGAYATNKIICVFMHRSQADYCEFDSNTKASPLISSMYISIHTKIARRLYNFDRIFCMQSRLRLVQCLLAPGSSWVGTLMPPARFEHPMLVRMYDH